MFTRILSVGELVCNSLYKTRLVLVWVQVGLEVMEKLNVDELCGISECEKQLRICAYANNRRTYFCYQGTQSRERAIRQAIKVREAAGLSVDYYNKFQRIPKLNAYNSTGYTGVSIEVRNGKEVGYLATWQEGVPPGRKQRSKTFSFSKYGDRAFEEAVLYRDRMANDYQPWKRIVTENTVMDRVQDIHAIAKGILRGQYATDELAGPALHMARYITKQQNRISTLRKLLAKEKEGLDEGLTLCSYERQLNNQLLYLGFVEDAENKQAQSQVDEALAELITGRNDEQL